MFNKYSTLGLLLMHCFFPIILLLPYKICTENINTNILGTDKPSLVRYSFIHMVPAYPLNFDSDILSLKHRKGQCVSEGVGGIYSTFKNKQIKNLSPTSN